MIVFTYLPPSDPLTIKATLKLVLAWQVSWRNQGFETRVLNWRHGADWLPAMTDLGGLYSDYRVRNNGWQLTKGDMGRAAADKVLALLPNEMLMFAKPAGYARLLTTESCLVQKEPDSFLEIV